MRVFGSLTEEFQRAVRICTGQSLSDHIVATVFTIFDDDGDGQLSYKEFIAIMKDRIHRGFKVRVSQEQYQFKQFCISGRNENDLVHLFFTRHRRFFDGLRRSKIRVYRGYKVRIHRGFKVRVIGALR